MSIEILHGQTSVVDDNGEVVLLHQETSASDVLITATHNTQGVDGSSVIPVDADTLQKLINLFGSLAFKTKIANDDLESEYLVVGDAEEGEYVAPETEINDNIISGSLTWSSAKINDLLNALKENLANGNFLIPVLKDANNAYRMDVTIEDIEYAYNKGRTIWAITPDMLLPLRHRVNAGTWVFSGYSDNKLYDFIIAATGLTMSINDLSSFNEKIEEIKKQIGVIPDDSDASNVIEYIDAKTDKIKDLVIEYDDDSNTVNFN